MRRMEKLEQMAKNLIIGKTYSISKDGSDAIRMAGKLESMDKTQTEIWLSFSHLDKPIRLSEHAILG